MLVAFGLGEMSRHECYWNLEYRESASFNLMTLAPPLRLQLNSRQAGNFDTRDGDS